jgi:hypothetical protein
MKNTHTHTQGPWRPVTLGASPDHTWVIAWAIDSELIEIAKLPEWPDDQAEAEANARLIAAAPEMLAALQDARDYLEALLGGGGDAAVDLLANSGEDVEARLSAAIAKATGREEA